MMIAFRAARWVLLLSLAAGLIAGGILVESLFESPTTARAPLAATDTTPTEVPPTCAITGTVLPQGLCEVQGVLLYAWLDNLANAVQFQNWKRDNPGEYSLLTAYMAEVTSNGNAAPVLASRLGAATVQVVQAYKYAGGAEPLVFPTPHPRPTTGDRQPPRMKGQLHVEATGAPPTLTR